jgi:hypothetical protein
MPLRFVEGPISNGQPRSISESASSDYSYVGLASAQWGCLILAAFREKSQPVSESSLFWISVKRNNAPDIRSNHDHLGFTGWALNVADHIRRIG